SASTSAPVAESSFSSTRTSTMSRRLESVANGSRPSRAATASRNSRSLGQFGAPSPTRYSSFGASSARALVAEKSPIATTSEPTRIGCISKVPVLKNPRTELVTPSTMLALLPVDLGGIRRSRRFLRDWVCERGRSARLLLEEAGHADAPFRLHEMHDLVEHHRDEDHHADDDEGPVRIEAPDARDLFRVDVANLKHVDAVVDDAHHGRADDDAEHRALAAAQRAAAEHRRSNRVKLVRDADLLRHLADV